MDPDPCSEEELETRLVHPFEAKKVYTCPGCNHEIHVGVGHVVVVPRGAPELRRHWHKACWANRSSRRPGR